MSTQQASTQPDTEPGFLELIPRPFDWKVVIILTLTALLLTASDYFGNYLKARHHVFNTPWFTAAAQYCGVEQPQRLLEDFFGRPGARGEPRLRQLQYWAVFHCILYFVIPALVIKLVLRERLRDYGLKLRGWSRRLWIYAGAFAVVLPLVLLFGRTQSFQGTYPFYPDAGRSWRDFLQWEAAYAAQFFALEFFFRGVLILGLKHRFGIYGVLVAMVPYCMIHFDKPLPETVGAIIAGMFLGGLSLWTRSIWLGFLIHVSVALSMDLTALAYKGELAKLFGS